MPLVLSLLVPGSVEPLAVGPFNNESVSMYHHHLQTARKYLKVTEKGRYWINVPEMPPPTSTKPREKVKKPKKPYEFKKAHIRLDEYKQEIRDRFLRLLFESAKNTLLTSWQIHLYIAVLLGISDLVS